MSLDCGFSFEAELMAAISEMEIAWERGWRSLWLGSDSIYVVSLLKARFPIVPWNICNHWLFTLQRIKSFSLHASHIFCEGNRVADALPRLTNDCNLWHKTPIFCLALSVLIVLITLCIVFLCRLRDTFFPLRGFFPLSFSSKRF